MSNLNPKNAFDKFLIDHSEELGLKVDNCYMCCESLKNKESYTLKCNHQIHSVCLIELLIDGRNTACGLCRSEIVINGEANVNRITQIERSRIRAQNEREAGARIERNAAYIKSKFPNLMR